MPKTITVRDESLVLELERGQVEILDRALTAFSRALVAARDMGVLSHGAMCAEADKARTVQYLVWACVEEQKQTGASQ